MSNTTWTWEDFSNQAAEAQKRARAHKIDFITYSAGLACMHIVATWVVVVSDPGAAVLVWPFLGTAYGAIVYREWAKWRAAKNEYDGSVALATERVVITTTITKEGS